MVSEQPLAQTPSAAAGDGGPGRKPLRQDTLLRWDLELAQREAKLQKDQQKREEDQQILNAGRKELAEHAEEVKLEELRLTWLTLGP